MSGSQQIRPFRFTGLPIVRRDEIEFFNAMAQITPAELGPTELPGQIFDRLAPYIHTQFQWQWSGVGRMVSLQQMERLCLSPTLLLHVLMLPLEKPIVIEIDPRLAGIMIDRTLGGSGESVDFTRPLTEIERGVFTYLLLKAIHEVQNAWGNNVQIEFRLEGIFHDMRELRNTIEGEANFYRKELHCGLIGQNGFIRVHIPTDFVTEIARSLPDPRNTPEEIPFLQQKLHRVADTPVCGLLRVGMIDLSEADFLGLLPDDVILIRECSVQRREEDRLWEGEGFLQFSDRPNFAMRCSLQNDPNHPNVRVCIEEITQLGDPPMIGTFDRSEYQMDEFPANPGEYEGGMDPHGDMGGENFEEMGPVLNDVPVPLVVELGRIDARARDIMYMRVGQVLELHRSPHEPLQLVVNNQVMGRGELIEVDGRLGIRIIELVR